MLVSARLLLRRQRFFVTFYLFVFFPVPELSVLGPVVTVLGLFQSHSDPGNGYQQGQFHDRLRICLGSDRVVTEFEPEGKHRAETQPRSKPTQREEQAIGKARRIRKVRRFNGEHSLSL